MRTMVLAVLAVASLAASFVRSNPIEEKKPMNVKRVTAVLYVNEVEPSLKFWTDRVGFTATAEVPDGDKLAFASLQKGTAEVMLQSFASAEKDVAGSSKEFHGPTFLYVEVDDLDALKGRMQGVKVEIPERKTFYGAREIGYKDPGGHVVLFAEFGK